MKTKDEERKALAKIKKIIDEMGPDSYIGMAFEGCVEDAEENIEYDLGNSYKLRYEHEMELLNETNVKLTASKREVEELQKKALNRLTMDEYTETNRLLYQYSIALQAERYDAEQDIIAFSDNPTDEDFKEAVAIRKSSIETLTRIQKITAEISEIMDCERR